MMVEWMKSAIVRSPLEGPAKAARRTLGLYKLWKHPELHEIWLEEARIARLIGKMVHESCNCIDVGGHLGAILSLFVKHAPRGRHWAFEPNPQQARWLERKFPGARQLVRRSGDQAALRIGSGNGRSGSSRTRRHSSSSPLRRAASRAAKASTPWGDQLIPWCLQRADTAQSLSFSTRVLAIHNPARCRCS
jgi:hypothetical protein